MAILKTQSNSRARVKNDTVGSAGLKQLFECYGTQSFEDFRTTCKGMIENSTGSRETKKRFFAEIDSARSKDMMLKKVTNYLLAGQGLGV